jgi:hypothetical protein
MSAKTCLLCGKPLSKIWIGAGEFCSREHRNQYRMRRGMDRLLEANQVASVIRRREIPKPISSLRPPAEGIRRAADGSTALFSARLGEPAFLPGRFAAPATRLAACGPLIGRPRSVNLEHREFGILRGMIPRVVPGFRPPRIEPPGSAYLNRARRPRPVLVSPRRGAALRVSAAAGFRLPPVRKDSLRVPRPRPAALVYPVRAFVPRSGQLNRMASAGELAVPMTPHAEWRLPGIDPALRGALEIPGVLSFARHLANGTASLAVRSSSQPWTPFDALPLHAVPYQPPVRAVPGYVRVKQRRFGGRDDPRLALVPLTPQEGQFRYSPVISVAVERAPVAVPVKLEESFDAGLKNWIGGIENWRVDAAGAHPGSLALYKPSLGLRDYELQFLVRVDKGAVTCVFRASGFDEYYAASVSAAPDGTREFSRRTVIAGAIESPEPLKLPPGTRAAFTVKLRARGREFSVHVDGQSIESWTDDRLQSGGIGFMGAPEDRARLYWVRISRLGDAGKEHSSI